MARASSSDCPATLRVMVGCEPGVSNVLPPFGDATPDTYTKCNDRPTPGQQPERGQLFLHAAPVGQQAGDRTGRGQELGDVYVLVWGVRHLHVARAVHDAGYIPETDKQAHVRAIGDASYGR